MITGFGQATKSRKINGSFTSMTLIGGVDCQPGLTPDLTVKGGALIKKTLCVKGHSDLKGNVHITKNLEVDGDIIVHGNINTNSGPVVSPKYQFSSDFYAQPGIDMSSSVTKNWPGELQVASGHMFNGPVGKPLQLTALVGQDSDGPFVCNLVIEELNAAELNMNGPVVGNITVMPFTGNGNANLFLNGTVVATKSPAFWHYYCVSGGTPSTTFLRGVHLTEV